MEKSLLVFLVCSTLVILTNMVFRFLKEKPNHACSHDYDVKEVLRTDGSVSILSTCKKCGKQKTHWFSSHSY
jgi:hypothetical protein